MIRTCPGIMIPRMMSRKAMFRPGKTRRDRANAAIEAKNTVRIAVRTDVMPLARYQFQISPAWKSVA